MVLGGFFNFLSPSTTQTQQAGQQQIKQAGQQQLKQTGQQQQRKQQLAQQQVADFVPQGKMQELPPLKETSSLFQPTDQLAQAIVKQADKQTQQSRQRLQQLKKQEQISDDKLLQAKEAHQQILRNARQIKSLLADITEKIQLNKIEQQETKRARQQQQNKIRQQTQQNKRVLKKMETESAELISELRSVLQKMTSPRKQTLRLQSAQVRQLQQVKQNLLQQDLMNKKTVQYNTPQGNKVRIQLSVRPDTKCCVAQSLAQKTRVHYRPTQQTVHV